MDSYSSVSYSQLKDQPEGLTGAPNSTAAASATPFSPPPSFAPSASAPPKADSKADVKHSSKSIVSANGQHKESPIKIGKELDDVIEKSDFGLERYLDEKLKDRPTEQRLKAREAQYKAVIQKFNEGITTSSIVTSWVRGDLINQDELFLVERNGVPELAMASTDRLAVPAVTGPGTTVTRKLPNPKKTDLCIGSNGRFLLNVPPGKYLLAYINNNPVIYGEGYHVVLNSTFQLKDPKNPNNSCVDKNQEHIQHGEGNFKIHILQMQPNKFAKILDGQEKTPRILQHREHPYVFQDPYFEIITPFLNDEKADKHESFFDVSSPYISHVNHHELRVPRGKIARVLVGPNAEAKILGEGSHVFDDINFKIVDNNGNKISGKEVKDLNAVFSDAQALYIHHVNHHQIRVPRGKIAKIFIGPEAEPVILTEGNHVFDDINFKIVDNKGKIASGRDVDVNNLYFDAQQEYINHGTIHIIQNKPGDIGLVFNNNKPEFLLSPSLSKEDNKDYASYTKQPENASKEMQALFKAYPNAHIINDKLFQFVVPSAHNTPGSRANVDHKYGGNKELFVKESESYIRHGNKHILRVPPGKYVKAWFGGRAEILTGTHFITDSTFSVENASSNELFGNLNEPYIEHGDLYKLQVPEGFIAKVLVNGKGKLVELNDPVVEMADHKSNEKLLPGFFRHSNFKLERHSKDELFVSTKEKEISFAGKLRLNPSSDEVVVLTRRMGGLPEVVKPIGVGQNKKATIIDDPSVGVRSWFKTTAKQFHFPSQEKILSNSKSSRKSGEIDRAKYEVATTIDQKEVGVQLSVQVQVKEEDVALAADNFANQEAAWSHVEDTAQIDIVKFITSNNYANILQNAPSQFVTNGETGKDSKGEQPGSNAFSMQLQTALRDHLKSKGLTLSNFGILDRQLLDEKVRDQMREANASSATLAVQAANLDTNATIKMREAKQAADVLEVQQKQLNESIVAKQKAALEAAKAEADATKAKAIAQAEATMANANAQQHAVNIRVESEQKLAYAKAENEQKIELLRAENYKKAVLLRAEADKAADLMKIEVERQKIENNRQAALLEVEKRVKEIQGIAQAYGIKGYADAETAKANAPVLAAALSKSNFQFMSNPHEMFAMMLMMQSGNLSMLQTMPGTTSALPVPPRTMPMMNQFGMFGGQNPALMPPATTVLDRSSVEDAARLPLSGFTNGQLIESVRGTSSLGQATADEKRDKPLSNAAGQTIFAPPPTAIASAAPTAGVTPIIAVGTDPSRNGVPTSKVALAS